MNFNIKDYYFYQAKKLKFPARSFFKLKEINEKYLFFSNKKKNLHILDLGAYPGSWSLYILSCFKSRFLGKLYLLDQQQIKLDPYFSKYVSCIDRSIFFIQKDIKILAEENYDLLKEYFKEDQNLDIILSDMLSNTTSQHALNHYDSLDLIKLIIPIVDRYLKVDGHFIFKVLDGEDLKSFLDEYLKIRFLKIKRFKPDASRKISRELYIICFNKKNYHSL